VDEVRAVAAFETLPLAVLSVMALALPVPAHAACGEPANTLRVYPLNLVEASLEVEYERVLGRAFSVYVSPRMRVGPGLFDREDGLDTDVLGRGVSAGVRWAFLACSPLSGLWLSPAVGVDRTRVTRDGARVEDTRWHVQALAGLTLPFAGAGVFSVGLGPRLQLGEVSVEEARVDTDVLVRFVLQASVGWAF
jgi:hypothetical protein